MVFFGYNCSNYATVASKHTVSKPATLEFVIKQLKRRVENASQLSNGDLQSLLKKLKSHKCDSAQALEILKCCSFTRMDENQTAIMTSIWNELNKQNIDFKTPHYNCLMQYFINIGELKRVQTIFDEMIASKLEPDE